MLIILFFALTFASSCSIDESARWCIRTCLELRKLLNTPEIIFSPIFFYKIREKLDTRLIQTPNPLWNQYLKNWIVAEQTQLNYFFVLSYWRILDKQITCFSNGILKWVPLDEIDHEVVPRFLPLFIPKGLENFCTDDLEVVLYQPLAKNEKLTSIIFAGNYDAFLTAHYWSIFAFWMTCNAHLYPFKIKQLFSMKHENSSLQAKIEALKDCWEEFWKLDHCKSPLLIHTLAHYMAYLRHYTIAIQADRNLYIAVFNLWQSFYERLLNFYEKIFDSVQFLFEVPVGKILPVGQKKRNCHVGKCKVFGVPWVRVKPYKPQTTLQYTEAGNDSYVSVFTSMNAKTNKAALLHQVTNFLHSNGVEC